uniref:Uncharacterized protein n=1 Tax=Tetranychus urticae TaxID=32264 RepID=A0A158P5G9_TETUR
MIDGDVIIWFVVACPAGNVTPMTFGGHLETTEDLAMNVGLGVGFRNCFRVLNLLEFNCLMAS